MRHDRGLYHFTCGFFPVLAALLTDWWVNSPPALLAFTFECHRTAMVMSRLVSREKKKTSLLSGSMSCFNLAQSALNRIHFLLLLEKTAKWEYSKWDLMFWCGGEGRGELLPDQMEQSTLLECLVRSLSEAQLWMEPSVPYWLKKLTSRALSMWSGLPADKEGPHTGC